MKKVTSLIEEQIVECYNDGFGIPEVAKRFALGKTTIHRVLKNNNVSMRTLSEVQRNPNIVHDFFSKYSKESCYWAGFTAADGCISNTKGPYYISFVLGEKDNEHLIKFGSAVGYDKPIRKQQQQTTYGLTKSCVLQFASKEMFMDLKNNFNITERKSKTLMPCLFVPDLFLNHYVRGYFDGDGHILDSNNNAIGFSGTREFLSWISQVIQESCYGVGSPSVVTDKGIFALRFTGKKQSVKIAKWLYEGSTPETRLERKYQIAKEKYGVS
jgi:hypothetical protein